MTPLDEIEKRAEDATEGPWECSVGNCGSIFGDLNTDHNGDNPFVGKVHGINPKTGINSDGKFIAHARTDIPRLCRALRKSIRHHERVAAADNEVARWSSRALRDIKNILEGKDE